MRKLVLKMSMSIDGFVGGPNHESQWIFETSDDESKAWTLDKISQAGVHAMGSRTFKDMASHWPTSGEIFAPLMNSIPKVVFSHHARPAGEIAPALGPNSESWQHARWAGGDLREQVEQLTREDGKPIVVYGGATLARSLVALDLVDEFQLAVHPVVLGRGLAVFTEVGAFRRLELIEHQRFPKGIVAHVYTRR